MADSFPKLIKGFIILSLFSFLIVGFAIKLGTTYNNPDVINLISQTGFEKINYTLSEINNTTEGFRESFQNQNVFLAIGGIVLTGIFQLGTSIYTIITLPFEILKNALINLKVPEIIVTIINVMIIFTFIFGLWRLVKAGW